MYDYPNKTALVTGAASGIGAAFARALSQRGMRLVLVDRNAAGLQSVAEKLPDALTIVADLSEPDAVRRIVAELDAHNRQIDLLINNAGYGLFGDFDSISAEADAAMLSVNINALVALTAAFLPGMKARGWNTGIINLASMQGFFPFPAQPVYCASKAFVLSFTQGLWAEYNKYGIRVMALCPGAVRTGFFSQMNVRLLASSMSASPEQVVETALKAFERGKLFCMPGWYNRVITFLPRILPRRFVAASAHTILPKTMRKEMPEKKLDGVNRV
jgi:uncharacterized protein